MTPCSLTKLQLELLGYVTSMAEPTWLMLEEIPELGGDRARLEGMLRELESRGLIQHSRELGLNPSAEPTDIEDWWRLTDRGWECLGETKPPRYW